MLLFSMLLLKRGWSYPEMGTDFFRVENNDSFLNKNRLFKLLNSKVLLFSNLSNLDVDNLDV